MWRRMVKRLRLGEPLTWICLHVLKWAPAKGSESQKVGCTQAQPAGGTHQNRHSHAPCPSRADLFVHLPSDQQLRMISCNSPSSVQPVPVLCHSWILQRKGLFFCHHKAARGRNAQTPIEALAAMGGGKEGGSATTSATKQHREITYIALIPLLFELENNNVNKVILACTFPGRIFSLQSSMSISLQPK